jgi:hypothetical protein
VSEERRLNWQNTYSPVEPLGSGRTVAASQAAWTACQHTWLASQQNTFARTTVRLMTRRGSKRYLFSLLECDSDRLLQWGSNAKGNKLVHCLHRSGERGRAHNPANLATAEQPINTS